MFPYIKAVNFKWRNQLSKFSNGAAQKLMECGCGFKKGGVVMPQDAMHVVEECLYLQNWRGELMRKLREVVVEGGHKVNVWDSWDDGEKIDFVLRPCIVGVFSQECEIRLKRQIGKL